MRHSAKGNAYLFMAAIVWGFSLAAQKEGLKYIEPLFFTAIRCLLGGLVMIPVVCMRMRAIRRENRGSDQVRPLLRSSDWDDHIAAADRSAVYVGGESRLHNGPVYFHNTHIRPFYGEKDDA